MTERLSDGLRNVMQRAFRRALRDSQIRIYSGAPPTEANDAVTGVHLVTITKASGAATTRSLPDMWRARVMKTGSTGTAISRLHIRYDPAGVTGATSTIQYTSGTDPTTKNLDSTLSGLVREINDNDFPYTAVKQGSTGQTGWFSVSCDVPGDEINIKGSTLVTGAIQSWNDSRGNWIYFNAPATGTVSKTTDVWSGSIITSGVAGYFRIVTADDDGTHSHSQVRIQGSVSTSGAEMNLTNTSLVAGTTLTIDSAAVTLPAE
jgi:hypothetical protein